MYSRPFNHEKKNKVKICAMKYKTYLKFIILTAIVGLSTTCLTEREGKNFSFFISSIVDLLRTNGKCVFC